MPVLPGQITALSSSFYFFGRRWASWQRLHRRRWELMAPPHFGQRRFFSFIVNVVRGRVSMSSISLVKAMMN
ncbi:MAG: hypothetical protein ABFC96_06890 [Thermoguttaceae bacterium]